MVSNHIRSVNSIISAKHLPILVLTSFSASMFVFGVVSIGVWETQLPIWGFVFVLRIGAFYIVYSSESWLKRHYMNQHGAFLSVSGVSIPSRFHMHM